MKLVFLLLFLSCQLSLLAKNVAVSGIVINDENQPIAYAHIRILNNSPGTVSNENGEFVFSFSELYKTDTLVISHIGHVTQRIPIYENIGKNIQVQLKKESFKLAEITVKPLSPIEVIHQVIDNISVNYFSQPVILKSFYRETIKENDHYTEYAEGVIDICKTPLIIGAKKFTPDELKLIKGRRKNDLSNYEIAKNPMVSIGGPVNCNYYDRMKYRPSFLRKSTLYKYDFSIKELTSNNMSIYIIDFDQKDSIEESLFKGKLFVDKKSYVVFRIEYGISPKGIPYTMPQGMAKALMKMFNMTFDDMSEQNIIDYQCVNNHWCLKSISQEEHLNMTRKGINYNMEIKKSLIITDVVTENVVEFNQKEVLSPKEFKNQIGEYDEDFWEGYNYLLPPEEMVSKLKLSQIAN